MEERIRELEVYTFWIFLVLFVISGLYVGLHPLDFIKGGKEGDNLEINCMPTQLGITDKLIYYGYYVDSQKQHCYITQIPYDYVYKTNNPFLWYLMQLLVFLSVLPTFIVAYYKIRIKFKKKSY